MYNVYEIEIYSGYQVTVNMAIGLLVPFVVVLFSFYNNNNYNNDFCQI